MWTIKPYMTISLCDLPSRMFNNDLETNVDEQLQLNFFLSTPDLNFNTMIDGWKRSHGFEKWKTFINELPVVFEEHV